MIEHGCNGGQLVDAVRELQSMVGDLRVRVDAIAPRASYGSGMIDAIEDFAPVPRADADKLRESEDVGHTAGACVHADDPKACYRVRCQLGNKCVDDDMSFRKSHAAGASNERADAAPKPSDKPYVETQPGSPNFDGAEAWEAHLDALFGPERADAEKDAALTKAHDALNHAKQFIENGIEFRYIQMPDPGLPDSAHDTLPTINKAIAAILAAKEKK